MHRVFWCARDHVLTASSPLNQKQTSQPICRDFQNGRCFRSRCVSNGKQEFLREREREKFPRGISFHFFSKGGFALFEIEIERKIEKTNKFLPQINITTVADFSTSYTEHGRCPGPITKRSVCILRAPATATAATTRRRQQQVGVCHDTGLPCRTNTNTPTGQTEPNVVNGNIIATRKRLVEEVDISSCLGATNRRQSSHLFSESVNGQPQTTLQAKTY